LRIGKGWVLAICAIAVMAAFLGLVLLAPDGDSEKPARTRQTTAPIPPEPPKFPGHADVTLFPENAEEAKEIRDKLIPPPCGGEKPGICPDVSDE
jgi:hypothetical protein